MDSINNTMCIRNDGKPLFIIHDMKTIYSKAITTEIECLVEDIIRDAFYEARLSHPMIGYKHKDVDEYLQHLSKNKLIR